MPLKLSSDQKRIRVAALNHLVKVGPNAGIPDEHGHFKTKSDLQANVTKKDAGVLLGELDQLEALLEDHQVPATILDLAFNIGRRMQNLITQLEPHGDLNRVLAAVKVHSAFRKRREGRYDGTEGDKRIILAEVDRLLAQHLGKSRSWAIDTALNDPGILDGLSKRDISSRTVHRWYARKNS